jgi:DNA-binding Lrp family transcriptional regulator
MSKMFFLLLLALSLGHVPMHAGAQPFSFMDSPPLPYSLQCRWEAVFDYKKIEEGHCTYILINLHQEKYGDPEEAARQIAKDPRVESIDICTGDYELLIKLRTKDIDEYYEFIKESIKKYGFAKTTSITSLKQIKTEFVELE